MSLASVSLWFIIGLCIGMLAIAAHLQPKEWSKWYWPGMLITGGCTGWLGGCLGVWLFGHLFAPITALWIAIAGTILMPRCIIVLWQNRPTKVTVV